MENRDRRVESSRADRSIRARGFGPVDENKRLRFDRTVVEETLVESFFCVSITRWRFFWAGYKVRNMTTD